MHFQNPPSYTPKKTPQKTKYFNLRAVKCFIYKSFSDSEITTGAALSKWGHSRDSISWSENKIKIF